MTHTAKPVFYQTADGDVYGGADLESIRAAMVWDGHEPDTVLTEVGADEQCACLDENEEVSDECIALIDAYIPGMGAYRITEPA